MIPVESSQIQSMGHDGVSTMKIQFTRGVPYVYSGVPPELFTQILESESVGKAFNSLIKAFPQTYPYAKA